MTNRIEIELTSARDDDTYTWRAAGARQPRGVVPISLLPSGSKVGDVLRVEVDVEIDGITVTAVLPPREKSAVAGRIEHIGPGRPVASVTTVLASKPERRGRMAREADTGERLRDRRPRTSTGRPGHRPRGDAEGPGDIPEKREAGDRPSTGRHPSSGRRLEDERRQAPDRGRPRREGRPSGKGDLAPRRGPVRFEPGTAHREAYFATLTPEERPIAEHLATGGLPAVRKALTDEQQRARAEGRPVASGEPIIAIAEQLLPDVKAAVWLDRAEAAIGRADEITLRDLRATVVAAAPRDEAGRELERQLREALDRRVTKLRRDWEEHLAHALENGRVLQALRLSAKPPEPAARFPASLVMPLAEQAGQAMTEETPPERWLTLLEAALLSPVRRQVKPLGMAKDPSGEVERQSRNAAGRLPALARLLGMPIPPPPQPLARNERPRTAPRRDKAGAAGAAGAAAAGESPGEVPSSPQARSSEDAVVDEEIGEPRGEV